ncbi:TetR/AcrR family transcriptional regulator C-terminal ligand-binding domain-containing protein [Nocardia beijingensis]|nr:TetR/AcrR family transcriptional regulator C-terminal ligand-binding domain-containing protein [Nocardia beijingensis]
MRADAQRDPELSKRSQDIVIRPCRAVLRTLLRRSVDNGEFAATVPLDLVVDFAFRAVRYRLLSRHAPLDGALVRDVAAAIAAMHGRGVKIGARWGFSVADI